MSKGPLDPLKTEIIKEVKAELVETVLQQFFSTDVKKQNDKLKKWITAALLICAVVLAGGFYLMNHTINDMYKTYIQDTEKIITAKSDIDLANAWERLPTEQRKERLREQYYKIVRYYTSTVPAEQRMSDEQIMDSFNKLWFCTQRVPSINFFFPVAYMKVLTNFNPVFNAEYKRGISGFYGKTAEATANLPIVKSDPYFRIDYKGIATLNNPLEAVALLMARIDDLMSTFNNREDWVFLALFTNEYDVISKYWDGGNGKIPDSLYVKGNLADALKYYYNFKSWQIPVVK